MANSFTQRIDGVFSNLAMIGLLAPLVLAVISVIAVH